jgi:hypothetical protein
LFVVGHGWFLSYTFLLYYTQVPALQALISGRDGCGILAGQNIVVF